MVKSVDLLCRRCILNEVDEGVWSKEHSFSYRLCEDKKGQQTNPSDPTLKAAAPLQQPL